MGFMEWAGLREKEQTEEQTPGTPQSVKEREQLKKRLIRLQLEVEVMQRKYPNETTQT